MEMIYVPYWLTFSGKEPLKREQSDYKVAQSGIKEMHTTTQRAQTK